MFVWIPGVTFDRLLVQFLSGVTL